MALSTSKRLLLKFLLALAIMFFLMLSFNDAIYTRALTQARPFPFPVCEKVWAHRGFAAMGGGNSLQSVQEAFRRGAAGVEIDVLFDRELNDFVVAHDRPYTLSSGKPLMLDTVLSQFAGTGFFWLDAKDLRKLSPVTAHKATQRLIHLIKRYQLTERAFVESSNALYLLWLANQGIFTSLAVSPNEQKYGAAVSELHADIAKLLFAFSGAGAVSMSAFRYTPVTASAFGSVTVLLSTVNDNGALQYLSAIHEVKVIL